MLSEFSLPLHASFSRRQESVSRCLLNLLPLCCSAAFVAAQRRIHTAHSIYMAEVRISRVFAQCLVLSSSWGIKGFIFSPLSLSLSSVVFSLFFFYFSYHFHHVFLLSTSARGNPEEPCSVSGSWCWSDVHDKLPCLVSLGPFAFDLSPLSGCYLYTLVYHV